jgi:eukaryotic-like serine/threonine-protein kinase
MMRGPTDDISPTGPTASARDHGNVEPPGGGPGDFPRAGLSGATVSWGSGPGDPDGPVSAAAPLRRVGQFVLLERLGAGGMGVVFAAFDAKLERMVAIKLVATQGSTERAHARLLREAQAQGRLSHPNVVTVYEVGALAEGGLFIAMELVRGPTLRAWQREPGRTWRDVVTMYTGAGAGLAAAHRGGIVHRDFKPDNVLVGDDGRARVADFGLAFATEPAPESPPGADVARSGPLPALTVAGAVMGTPGYMAPEQLVGGAVDARTDQFSFCVALYEALHGERPFADRAFWGGARPAPRRSEPDPGYPRWVWDVVMRGLAADPAQRYASMEALVTELSRSRDRTRRRVIAGAAVVGAMAIAGVASVALIGRSPPPCPLPTAELAGVWDAAVQQRLRVAVLGTGAAFAPAVWASTEGALDRYAQRWLGAQQAACEATHVRHVQSAALLDRRTECLAGRRRSLAAATEVLLGQPAQAIAHAGDVLASLGDVALCADTGALLASGPTAPVSNPARAAQIAEARRLLARASALLATGDVGRAEPVVATAGQLARALDHGPLTAEVRYAEGRVQLARGELATSISILNEAVALAVASRHDELPADIWLTLAVSGATRDQRPAEIERWLGQADAWLRRLGHASDPRKIDAEFARGNLQLTAGDARAAVATLSSAIESAELLRGKDDPRIIPLLRARSVGLARLRHATSAVVDGERALAIGISAWGEHYPDIASTRRMLGLLYIEQLGDVERGETQIGLALDLYRTNVGADSIEVANCEQGLSQVGQFRGDYAAALDHAERAEQIYARRLGADHPRRGEALIGLGVLRFMRHDLAGSLAAYDAALPIMQAALGAGHTTVGILLSNTGETLLAMGRADAAQADFAQALEILQKALGPDHADLALPLKGLGLAALHRGRAAQAVAPLERALALRTRSAAASDPQELAEIWWGLARALRAVGRDPPRARELAESAVAAYGGLGPGWAPRVAEIARWLGK